MTVNQIAALGAVVVFLLVTGGLAAWLRGRRHDRAAEAEAVREYDSGQYQAPAQAGPADLDDLYPAQPAAQPPPGPHDAQGLGPAGTADSADGAPRTLEALAQVTAGETLAEEIDRTEARLAYLYELAEAEILAGRDPVAADLASGRLRRTDWLLAAAEVPAIAAALARPSVQEQAAGVRP